MWTASVFVPDGKETSRPLRGSCVPRHLSQAVFCTLDRSLTFLFFIFLIFSIFLFVWKSDEWFLVAYPVSYALAVIRTSWGITGWQLQANHLRHGAVLSGWAGQKEGVVTVLALWVSSLCSLHSHSTLLIVCWAQHLQWFSVLYLMKKEVQPDQWLVLGCSHLALLTGDLSPQPFSGEVPPQLMMRVFFEMGNIIRQSTKLLHFSHWSPMILS